VAQKIRGWFFGLLIFVIYNCFRITWRIRVHEDHDLPDRIQSGENFILCHWHGDEIVLLSQVRRMQTTTMASLSRDGEIMSALYRLMGGNVVRGSSSRNAVGSFKSLLKIVLSGRRTSFAVDGPKGPLHQVKSGALEVSRVAQVPIFFAGVYCDRAWRFEKSWNKTYFPKPFAKISIFWKGPFGPLEKSTDPRDSKLLLEAKEILRMAQDLACKKIEGIKSEC
jgi:lysophospholipid acyltransferase (LPLAT)-like uncharacterized protein